MLVKGTEEISCMGIMYSFIGWKCYTKFDVSNEETTGAMSIRVNFYRCLPVTRLSGHYHFRYTYHLSLHNSVVTIITLSGYSVQQLDVVHANNSKHDKCNCPAIKLGRGSWRKWRPLAAGTGY